MNPYDIRPLIDQLSKSTSKEGQVIIKAFLSGTYKSDYDRVMTIIDKNVYVPIISKDTIDNAVECTKLFNEAIALSQNLNDEQQKEAELRREEIAQKFKEYCYKTIDSYGIKIE
ncbi:MAG: hypothetical protein HFJ87_06645 [Muribaculaceae bacterium]|nr:hypothetical protein [Muribaculaceae bacterium]